MVHITVTSDPLKMPSLELLERAHEAVCPVNVMFSIPPSCHPRKMATYSLTGSAGLHKYQHTRQRQELRGYSVSF